MATAPVHDTEILVRAVESDDEAACAARLFTQVHTDIDIVTARWLEANAAQYPGYRREHTRIALRGREIVGGLRLTTDTVRIGEARLKMGGIGWVSTVPGHRKRGVCRRLFDDVLAYMAEHGYHVSMLWGIPNFYHRFGYTTTLSDHSIRVDTMEARTFDNPFRVSTAKPGDVPALLKLHNAGERNTTCSIIRTSAHLKNRWGIRQGWHMLKDDEGRAVAYFNARRIGDTFNVIETGLEAPGLSAAVIGAAGRMAQNEGLATVRFHVPPNHAFARYWLQFPSVHETRVYRDAEGMMRIINIEETLESMVPEWESRLADSGARELSGECTLVVESVPYRIRARHGAVDVARLQGLGKIPITQADLMHLLTGYRFPEDVLADSRHGVSGDVRTLFVTLFPKRNPYVWIHDRF